MLELNGNLKREGIKYLNPTLNLYSWNEATFPNPSITIFLKRKKFSKQKALYRVFKN